MDFRREYRGSYWLEILLVKNLNSGPESLAALRRWVERIAPDRVHLNTVARPPAEAGLLPLPQEELTEIARSFHPPAEVIAEYRPRETKPLGTADPDEILAMLQRHPGTADDVAAGLSLAPTEAAQVLETMLQDGRLSVQECDGRRFSPRETVSAMSEFSVVMLKIMAMFLVMAVGWVAHRRAYINDVTVGFLSRLVVDLVFLAWCCPRCCARWMPMC